LKLSAPADRTSQQANTARTQERIERLGMPCVSFNQSHYGDEDTRAINLKGAIILSLSFDI
jgi:hypothetical protein